MGDVCILTKYFDFYPASTCSMYVVFRWKVYLRVNCKYLQCVSILIAKICFILMLFALKKGAPLMGHCRILHHQTKIIKLHSMHILCVRVHMFQGFCTCICVRCVACSGLSFRSHSQYQQLPKSELTYGNGKEAVIHLLTNLSTVRVAYKQILPTIRQN